MITFDPSRLEGEVERLETEMSSPGIWDDREHATDTSRRLEHIRKRLARYRSLNEVLEEIEVLHGLAEEIGDEEELQALAARAATLQSDLAAFRIELTLSDPLDPEACYLSIQAGAGGADSQDWAEMLLRMFARWCERTRFRASLLEVSPGEPAGIRSATMEIAGDYAYGYLKGESGVHRLVRISPFDSAHRRHTSFSAVSVVPVTEQQQLEIDPKDLRIDTYRSSGAGGQHVNVTDSAVRITHIPTGVVVSCQNERSQHQNKETAMKILHARLGELLRRQEAARLDELKGEQKEIEWGSQIRSYVLQPYRMVKDHRTGVETGNVDAVLDGDIAMFLEAYLEQPSGTDETSR